jgi:hypothetical protein
MSSDNKGDIHTIVTTCDSGINTKRQAYPNHFTVSNQYHQQWGSSFVFCLRLCSAKVINWKWLILTLFSREQGAKDMSIRSSGSQISTQTSLRFLTCLRSNTGIRMGVEVENILSIYANLFNASHNIWRFNKEYLSGNGYHCFSPILYIIVINTKTEDILVH